MFIILIITPISQASYSGIFSILDGVYINNISELPYSSGNPVVNWQEHGHLRAWIDVTGFRNVSRIDGLNYTYGSQDSEAIINYDAKSYFSCKYELCYEDSITSTITTTQNGNMTVAKLHVVLNWTSIYCYDGCQNKHHTDEADFYAQKESPIQFNKTISISNLEVTEYNNSVNPKTVLNLTGDNIFYVEYAYKNESIRNYKRVAQVETDANGIYFANVSGEKNIWSENTPTLHHQNGIAIIQTDDPDYINLTISVSNLYQTKTIETMSSRRREDFRVEDSFPPILINSTLMFTVVLGLCVYIIRRK